MKDEKTQSDIDQILNNSYGVPKRIIPICSILPYVYKEASELRKTTKKHKDIYSKIMKYIGNCLPLAKWTVNNLVDNRRKHQRDFKNSKHQEAIYEEGKDYKDELYKAVKAADENFNLPIPKTKISDHINTDNKEFLLWQQVFKVYKMIQEIPEEDRGDLEKYINASIDCSYRICKKFKEYNDKYKTGFVQKVPDVIK